MCRFATGDDVSVSGSQESANRLEMRVAHSMINEGRLRTITPDQVRLPPLLKTVLSFTADLNEGLTGQLQRDGVLQVARAASPACHHKLGTTQRADDSNSFAKPAISTPDEATSLECKR